MCSASLSSLTNVLIQRILADIHNPRHLLSFAATSQRFYEIVDSSQISYWKIRCDPRRNSLWKELYENAALASRIRILELVREDDDDTSDKILVPYYTLRDSTVDGDQYSDYYEDEKLCSWGYNDEFLECMVALADALRQMKQLFRFCWSFWPASDVGFHLVAETLQHNCPLLRELQVEYNQESCQLNTLFHQIGAPLWGLSELTSLALTVIEQVPGPDQHPKYLDPLMIILLTRCPNLEQLYLCLKASLDGSKPILGSRLLAAKWPQLKRLSLSGFIKLYKKDIDNKPRSRALLLKRFFKAHPRLESLTIDYVWLSPISGGVFNSETTPNLRSLSILPDHGHGPIQDIISAEFAGKLVHFSVAPTVNCLSLLREMRGLCSLSLVNPLNYTLLDVASCVPNVQRLSVYIPSDSCSSQAIIKMIPHLVHLSNFQRLTHLAWLFDQVDISTPEGEGLVILTAASISTLKYIQVACDDMYDGPDTIWIKLQRDNFGTYSGYTIVQDAERLELEVWTPTWGDYFTGFVPQ